MCLSDLPFKFFCLCIVIVTEKQSYLVTVQPATIAQTTLRASTTIRARREPSAMWPTYMVKTTVDHAQEDITVDLRVSVMQSVLN